MRIGYEARMRAHMAMIMSYPTRTRGIIVLLKTLPQYGKLTKKKKKLHVHKPFLQSMVFLVYHDGKASEIS